RIVDAEGIAVAEESLQLIARDAEGSMRDAQSKLDQVIAFTGTTITAEDVARRPRSARGFGGSGPRERSRDRRRRRARSPQVARRTLLAGGPTARLRSAYEGRDRHSRRRAAAVSPRDGAAAVDPFAQARADRGSHRRCGTARRPDT